MTVVERFLLLKLPPSQCVVIGSGILDALKLRVSRDIDLVASSDLFETLQSSGDWSLSQRRGEPRLEKGDVEVWRSWGNDGQPNFEALAAGSVTIDGVKFANPRFVIAQKLKRSQQKDLRDIMLLERFEKNE